MQNLVHETAMTGRTGLRCPPSGGFGRRLFGVAACLWLCQCLGPAVAGSGAAVPSAASEYALKAAFLYNFTKFVEWPEARFGDQRSPLVIGVLGSDPFGAELAGVVRGRKVKGREITIVHFSNAEAAKGAHLLFVNTDGADAESLRAVLGAYGVLTVGESERFARSGGIVTFRARGDRLGFEINAAAAERAGLRISAQLLKLATAVRREG